MVFNYSDHAISHSVTAIYVHARSHMMAGDVIFRDHYGRDIFENKDQGPNSIYV